MYVLAFQRSGEGILVFISRVARQRRNKHQNNTRVSAETVRHESTYIILFLTRHNGSINVDKTTIFTHRPRVSLARFSFCWWRHNRLLMTSHWPDNCDAITWIVISKSLDFDFIHGDIHGRSCKKLLTAMLVNLVQILLPPKRSNFRFFPW